MQHRAHPQRASATCPDRRSAPDVHLLAASRAIFHGRSPDPHSVATAARLAAALVRVNMAECLDAYFARAPSTPPDAAARELAAQLAMIGARVDGLEAQVPDEHARRAEDLTRDMRRRHGSGD